MTTKKKSNIIMIVLIIAIILVIIGIEYIQGDWFNGDEKTLKCIADNSVLYVSKTCSHCAAQKLELGDDIKFFNIIDCTEDPDKCVEAELIGVPTWIINEEKYPGRRTIEELKELTNC